MLYKSLKENISYIRFNITILKLLALENIIISLGDVHGFMQYIIYRKEVINKMNILTKLYALSKINKIVCNSIVYNEIFIPSNRVIYYLKRFSHKRNNKKILGIHIRSGIFFNNYTEKYFSRIYLTSFYNRAKQIIQNNNLSFVFIISDNYNFLNKAKLYFKEIIININFRGDIIHSKFSLYNTKFNYNALRIVAEFIILSTCDYIIGTKRSSFSMEACNRLMKRCTFI